VDEIVSTGSTSGWNTESPDTEYAAVLVNARVFAQTAGELGFPASPPLTKQHRSLIG
jgi:hypothetical protein